MIQCTGFFDNHVLTPLSVEPPYFTVRPRPAYNLKVGDSVTMPCAALSNRIDQPAITWRKVCLNNE